MKWFDFFKKNKVEEVKEEEVSTSSEYNDIDLKVKEICKSIEEETKKIQKMTITLSCILEDAKILL